MTRKPIVAGAAFILIAGFLALFIGGGARFTVGLTLRPIVDDLGWARSDLGLAVALYQVVSAAATFAAGMLADRAGPRLVLSGGILVSGIGIGLMSTMTIPWHALALYGAVFALGSGAASMAPVGVMVTRVFPQRTGIANAVVMSGMTAGQLVMIASLAAAMLSLSWRSVYLLIGVAHLVLVPLLIVAIPKMTAGQATAARPAGGIGVIEAARSRRFWLLLAVYAICGFDDFFVTIHVAAFAQDRGVDAFLAGNLLALMGLTGLIGVVAAGALSDRSGPVWPTALCFAARVAVFTLVMVDQSTISVAVFALVFGVTFLVTAPLTVVFVAQSFGTRHLGALTGLITMVHQIFGGIGAYLGAVVFDVRGNYDIAFAIMLAVSFVALLLTLMLRRPRLVVPAKAGTHTP
ncbi:MAG: MFS transporter [Rhizobiales bacterium]|nr:MFS transporter [Hyphomicrobiales bacterium]